MLVTVILGMSSCFNTETVPDPKLEYEPTTTSISAHQVKQIKKQLRETVNLNKLLVNEGYPFNASLPNDADNYSKYFNSMERCFNLGAYLSDLNYMLSYDQSQLKGKHIESIMKLTDQLDVNNSFDTEKLRFLLNSDALDSDEEMIYLEEIVYQAQKKINDDERAQLAAMILSGAWLESLYLTCNAVDNDKISTQVAEGIETNVASLDDVLTSLAYFDYNTSCASLTTEMEQLIPIMEKITHKGNTDFNNQLAELGQRVSEIRNRMTHNQE